MELLEQLLLRYNPAATTRRQIRVKIMHATRQAGSFFLEINDAGTFTNRRPVAV